MVIGGELKKCPYDIVSRCCIVFSVFIRDGIFDNPAVTIKYRSKMQLSYYKGCSVSPGT
jgi:hypothetical protein